MRRRRLIGVLIGLAALTFAAPAGAEDRAPGQGGAYIDPDNKPTAEAHQEPSGGTGGEELVVDDSCEWRVAIEDDFEFGVYDVDFTRQYSATGRWLERWCEGEGLVHVDYRSIVPEGGLVDPYQLATDALASIEIAGPDIRTSPSRSGRLYVAVPTWLWVDDGWWQTYEATARAGRVWSTVRAAPVTTTWNTGDGNSVACSGQGTAWEPGMPEDGTDCSHTYRRSSASEPGGTFDLEATVTIEVSWSSNAAGGGTLPGISRTSSVPVEVGEIQAIGTKGG